MKIEWKEQRLEPDNLRGIGARIFLLKTKHLTATLRIHHKAILPAVASLDIDDKATYCFVGGIRSNLRVVRDNIEVSEVIDSPHAGQVEIRTIEAIRTLDWTPWFGYDIGLRKLSYIPKSDAKSQIAEAVFIPEAQSIILPTKLLEEQALLVTSVLLLTLGARHPL